MKLTKKQQDFADYYIELEVLKKQLLKLDIQRIMLELVLTNCWQMLA